MKFMMSCKLMLEMHCSKDSVVEKDTKITDSVLFSNTLFILQGAVSSDRLIRLDESTNTKVNYL